MTRARVILAVVVFGAVCVSGCGLNMEQHYRNYRSDLLDRNFDAAAKYLDATRKNFYDKKSRLLYYMDKAMVLYLGRHYAASNKVLETAKLTAQELWTQSIGEHAESWLTTDNSISYQGEDFEKVMLNVLAALDYMGLHDLSDARVEARQVTEKLQLYNSKYGDKKNVYRDDAFARWLAGKLAETAGDMTALNNAWIDYKKAIALYETDYARRYHTPVPTDLVADGLRVLQALGPDFQQDLAALRAKYPTVQFTPEAKALKMGRVVFIHLGGEAPYKIDQYWTAYIQGDVLRIAFPKFVAKPYRIVRARMQVGGEQATTELAENVTAIAIQNLQDHMARIKAKAIARAVAKFVAGKAAETGGKVLSNRGTAKAGAAGTALQVVGALWNAGNAVAEQADKRSWITLPAYFGMGQMLVPPGPVSVRVDFLDRQGQVLQSITLQGTVQAGHTLFLSYRTFR